ncbi:MAG: hypothetical protein CSA62_12425 [Planctomycetota bacterium]|nr:MAG: hypothetical protein CSA62_12425 [Planctomycetota bacterium]
MSFLLPLAVAALLFAPLSPFALSQAQLGSLAQAPAAQDKRPEIGEWIQTLKTGAFAQKVEAAHRLSEFGAVAAPMLAQLLRETEDVDVLICAFRALRGMDADAAPAVSALRSLLSSEVERVRGYAIEVLGRIGVPAAAVAAKDIRKLWGDPSLRVQCVAVVVYAKLADPSQELAADLASQLRSKNAPLRRSAALALAQVGELAMTQLDLMIASMRDPDGMVRAAAAQSVGRIGPKALPALLKFEKSAKSVEDREAACIGLASLAVPAPEQLKLLVKMAAEPSLRRFALEGLRRCGRAGALAQLEFIKAKENPQLAKEMLENIGAGGKPVEALSSEIAALLKDPDPHLRWGAAHAIASIGQGDASVVEALSLALDDELPPVRILALTALARIGKESKDILPKLVRLLRSGDEEQGYHVAQALRIYGADALPVLDELLSALGNGDERVRFWAIQAIAGIGPATLPRLRAALEDENYAHKVEILRAIGQMGSAAAEAGAWVQPLLASLEPKLCVAATRTLMQVGGKSPERLSRFAALLQRSEPEVQVAAIAALGKAAVARPDLALQLLPLLEAPSGRVRRAALEALGAIGDAAVVPALMKCLQDEAEHIRWRAITALGSIGARQKLGKHLRQVVAKVEAMSRQDRSAYVPPAARKALKQIRGG